MNQHPAQIVGNFIAFHRGGILSTISQSVEGFPFGSVVPYDVDQEGHLVIFVSLISQHYRNLTANPRASICIQDFFGLSDPQAHARATVLGEFTRIPDTAQEETLERYSRRFPDAPERSIAHDFCFFRLTTTRIRWIGGFGDIRWIEAADYHTAPLDEVAYQGWPAVAHMNEDHSDAIAEYALHFGNIQASPENCQMVDIDRSGFSVSATSGGNSKRIRVSFPKPLEAPGETRKAMIELLKICRLASSP